MGPGPSLLRGSLWPRSALGTAQPSAGTGRGPPSVGGEGAGPLKGLSNGNQDIFGGLFTNGHEIPECLCLVATVMPRGQGAKSEGCSAGLAPAGRPCRGLVAREQCCCRGCGEANRVSILSAQIVSLLSFCASKNAVCLSLEDTLPSASK